ncbi:MAG: Maf family protein [Chthoniobacterales bacterium]
MSQPPLVLASTSPRRHALLRSAGLDFTVVTADAVELDDPALGLAGLVLTNARAKALAVMPAHPNAVVLAADTLVWLDGRPLGKPADLAAARSMLRALSGRVHEVATGVHLGRIEPTARVEFHEVSYVRFRPLDDALIERYVASVEILDKAGAYAVQEQGEMLIAQVEGSHTNVIGLPLTRTLAALRAIELEPFVAARAGEAAARRRFMSRL